MRLPTCLSLALLFSFALLPGTAKAERPNIIYILADDAGYGDFSCYGQEKFETPRIDQLAQRGLKFTQHYSGATVCAPSRCALLTGYHTGHTYVRGNREVQPVGQSPIPADTLTLPKLLKKAGYVTGAFGKWGLGYPGSEGDPMKQGFDRFFGYNCQRNAHTYYPTWMFDDDQKIELDGKTYSHDLIMDEALQFIRDNQQESFFCYLPVAIPHAAMHVTEEYSAPFREKFPQFENKIGRYAGTQVKNPVAAFAGMMVKLDEDVGRVIDLVEELGLTDNTLIIFTSDNGPHVEGGHDPEFFNSNGPLNGFKRDLTDGGIRVPMIATWPGKIKPASQTDHISAFWDIMPTVCDLAEIETPKGIDGISFVPTLLGKPDQPQHEYLYWEFHERGGKRAIRMGKWKAVQVNMAKNPNAPIALYDVIADIGETTDVSADHPEVMAKVRKIFQEAREPSEVFQFPFEKRAERKAS